MTDPIASVAKLQVCLKIDEYLSAVTSMLEDSSRDPKLELTIAESFDSISSILTTLETGGDENVKRGCPEFLTTIDSLMQSMTSAATTVVERAPELEDRYAWHQIRTPREAEYMAAWHMKTLGFADAEATQASVDGGIDAVSADAAAQVKFYSNTRVFAPDIQRLRGAAFSKEWALFYASSGYTRQAVAAAESSNVALFEFDPETATVTPRSSAADYLARNATPGQEHAKFAHYRKARALDEQIDSLRGRSFSIQFLLPITLREEVDEDEDLDDFDISELRTRSTGPTAAPPPNPWDNPEALQEARREYLASIGKELPDTGFSKPRLRDYIGVSFIPLFFFVGFTEEQSVTTPIHNGLHSILAYISLTALFHTLFGRSWLRILGIHSRLFSSLVAISIFYWVGSTLP